MSKIYDALRKAEREKQGQRRKTPIKAKRPAKAGARLSDSDLQRDSRLLDGLEEDFRRSLLTLRNAVESEIRDSETRLIVFTSAVKGEGKTTILSAFSRVMAIGGSKSLCVVDCSVRSPGLHSMFGVDNDVGVIEYLSGEAELDAIIHDIEGIHFIPAGVTANIDISMPLFNSAHLSQTQAPRVKSGCPARIFVLTDLKHLGNLNTDIYSAIFRIRTRIAGKMRF